jgi:hypothetical protein|tara:strand:+ start:584 stop:928 length:345 start_codon:yes stop_codon:yes gene_type:complete
MPNYRNIYEMGGRPMRGGRPTPMRGNPGMGGPSSPSGKVSKQEMFNRLVERYMSEGMPQDEAVKKANEVMNNMAGTKAMDGGKKKKKKKKKSTPKYKDGGSVFGIQNGGRSPFS